RSPMNSWHLSDSYDDLNIDTPIGITCECIKIGEKDMDLAKRLIKGGSEHCKFLRQIQVWVDLNLPRYIWSEFDTYKFNTKNSCSTMHKLFTVNPIILSDFYYENDKEKEVLSCMVDLLNELRIEYLDTKNYEFVRTGKRILPESFLQLRTVNTNYAELINIYHQRKNHRLKNEWGMICKWIESLPYMKEFLEVN
ncbi:hypothetical protein, partial [Clostridium sp.]|uniref:hypothetical protein n=1 Tax=Clostridium sp. TaxID=1506 RepID=UPI003F2F56FB